MRTQAQIIVDCEARMAELERQAAERSKPRCRNCKWLVGFTGCREPLVTGFSKEVPNAEMSDREHLCGSEYALWQPQETAAWRVPTWLKAVLVGLISFLATSAILRIFA